MYNKFSSQAKGIILRSHRYAINRNEFVVGTEYLLLSLYNEPDSSCQILLKEMNISEDEILSALENINVFRKNIPGLIIYTPKFRLVLEKAIEIAQKTQSDLVYEEHLFYALLKTPDCIAHCVLKALNIDITDIIGEIIDVMGWNFEVPKKKKPYLNNFPFIENITLMVEKGKLLPLIGREEVLERINHILNKRNKRNVILIGNAGVGKTAIVEGLAQKYYEEKRPVQFIALNVTSLIAGTKYRGDFEQRIKDFIDAVKDREDIILFIDEIHNIINTGNSDNNLDIANILKPSLARGEIRCIGATTSDEYYKYIVSDAALARRFHPLFIDEPTVNETVNILLNVKNHYENYHHLTIPSDTVTYLCEHVEKALIDRYFPDKALDVLDEACAIAKSHNLKTVTPQIVSETIQTINNQYLKPQGLETLKKYPFLKKYYLRYVSNVRPSFQPIVSILSDYQEEAELNSFLDDLKLIFNIRSEAVKKINLSNFTDAHSISNLIGAPPGYIGFDNPNTLTKFVQKYPRSLILFKNIESCAVNITELLSEILTSGYIEDFANNKIYFTNTIIVGTTENKTKNIGFLDTAKQSTYKGSLTFNERIRLSNYLSGEHSTKPESLLKQYRAFFQNQNIDLVFPKYDLLVKASEENQDFDLESLLFDCLFTYKKKSYVIDYDETSRAFIIKK